MASLVLEAGLLGYLLTIPFGPDLLVPVRTLALSALVLGIALARLGGSRASPPGLELVAPFLLFAATTCLAIATSGNPSLSLSRASYLPIGFLFFVAVQDACRTPAALSRLGAALAVVVALLGVDAIHQFAQGASWLAGRPTLGGRIRGSLPHPNDLTMAAVFLPLALLTLARWGWLPARLLVGSALLLGCGALTLSQSRSAALGLLAAASSYGLLGRSRRAVGWLLATGALLAAVAIGLGIENRVTRLMRPDALARDGRIGIWLVAWEMFSESPVLGKGAFTFGDHYSRYLETVDLPESYQPERRRIPWPHNLVLEMLAERGAIGLAGFLALLVAMGATLRRCLRAESPREIRQSARAAAASFGAFLAMSLFELTFLKDWVVLAFCLLAGVCGALRRLRG
jgi:O-antigen ligase